MILAYENSGINMKRGDRMMIENMIKECNVCKRSNKLNPRPKHAFSKVIEFNQVVFWI